MGKDGQSVDQNGPMGEVSFLDDNLVGEESQAVELKVAKKSSTAQIFNDILQGVEDGDVRAVESALNHMKEKPGSGWMNRLAKALVKTRPFNTEIAELMHGSEIITFYLLYSALDEVEDNAAVAWMLSSPEKNKIAKSQIGRGNLGERKKSLGHVLRRMVRQGDLRTLAQLDIGEILRGEKREMGYLGDMFFNSIVKLSKDKHLGELWNKILDPETVAKVFADDGEDVLRHEMLFICDQMARRLCRGDKETIEHIERSLRKSHRLAQAWSSYWEGKEVPGNKYPTHTNLTPSYLSSWYYQGRLGKMGVEPGPTKDPLELMLIAGNEVVMDALSKEGPLSDALYKRLSEGNGHMVHIVISHAKSKKIIPTITSMMARMGMDWEDNLGRGWGHSLVLAPDELNINHIQSFIRDPKASKLLMKPDHSGRSAMDVLVQHPKFKDNTALLTRIRRSLLTKSLTAGKRRTQSLKNRGPVM